MNNKLNNKITNKLNNKITNKLNNKLIKLKRFRKLDSSVVVRRVVNITVSHVIYFTIIY